MRDSYTSGYFRQEQKSGLIGVYESTGLHEAWAPRGFPEWESSQRAVSGRLGPHRALARTGHRAHADLRRGGHSPRHQRRHSAHPRRRAAARPAAGLKNFWMCCGTSFGIAQGGGCGKYLAQWMLHGDAEINMTEFDPRRFGNFADADYVRDKVFQDYRLTFTTRRPGEEEWPDGRAKMSPLHERLKRPRLRAHRDLRLGASEMVLARRPRRRLRLCAQQCVRGRGRRSRGRARARGDSRSDGIRQVRHQRRRGRVLFEPHLRQSSAAQGRRHRAGASAVAGRAYSRRDDRQPPWPTIASTRCRRPPRNCAIWIC